MRVGLGQHEKCYAKNSSFSLGGILISEGSHTYPTDQDDLLIYSIADALLGAAALGGFFQSANYSDIFKSSGQDLLRQIEKDIHYLKFKISNIDVSIAASFMKLENKITEIHTNLVSWLYLKPEQLNLKITPIQDKGTAQDIQIKIISTALLENR